MKPPYKVLSLLLLFPFFAAAQSNYKPGYVITTKGDTLKGYIDYQAWDSNPTAISFKPAIGDRDKKTFNLNNASLFSIEKVATYKKYFCKISTDITNTNQIGEGRDTSFRLDTVFLKVLQKGKNVALYAYTDNVKTRFYIGEAPDYAPTELVFRLYYDVSASKNGRTVNENTYQKQLFALANKYNAMDDNLTNAFQNLNYDEVGIIGIVSRINDISREEVAKKYSGHSAVSFYVGGAMNIAKTTSAALSSYTLGGGVPYTSYQPGLALGLDIIPDPDGGKAELKLDLAVSPGQMNALYTLKVSPYIGAKASYNQLGIFLTPQVQYNFYNTPDFRFFVGAGLSLTYISYSKPYFQSQDASAPNAYFPIEQYYFTSVGNSFLIKTGFRIHKNWELYYNYNTSLATTKGGYFGFNVEIQQVGVNYFFSK
jgi:hypothetical protein